MKSNKNSDLIQLLQSSLKEIPSEYKKDSFSHIPIVAKSLSAPQETLKNLERYIQTLQNAVDEITKVHYREFNQSIRNFSKSLDYVNQSCERVDIMVQNLDECEKLLQTRVEDLSQLYTSYLQHSECVRILTMVEEIREVPKKLTETIEKKNYLNAAELIESCVNKLEKEELKEIKGLSEIRNEIYAYQTKLPEILVKELNEFCYSTIGYKDQVRKPNQESQTQNTNEFEEEIQDEENPEKKNFMEGDPVVDYIGGNTKMDSEKFIFMVIQALDTLKMLPDAQSSLIQDLKKNIRQLIENHILEFKLKFSESEEYWNLIHSSDPSLSSVLRVKKQVGPMRRLLKDLFEKLLAVFSNFQYVIEKITSKLSSNPVYKLHRRKSVNAKMTKDSLKRMKDSIRLKINSLMTNHLTNRTQPKSLTISTLELFSKKLDSLSLEGMTATSLSSNLMNVAKSITNPKPVSESDTHILQDVLDDILSDIFTSDTSLLTLHHIWNEMQMELQSILEDILNARSNLSTNVDQESTPKQITEIKFKFGVNIGAPSTSNEILDGIVQGGTDLCAPLSDIFLFTPYNLIYIHKTLIGFINKVEDLDSSCQSEILISFIEMVVIPDILINRVTSDYLTKLTERLEMQDAFQPNISLKKEEFMVADLNSVQLRSKLPRVPIMNSVLSLVDWMKDLISFSASMPRYRESFYTIIDQLLKKFYDMCKIKIESSLAGTYAMECMWTKQEEAFSILKQDPMWKKLTEPNYFKSKSYQDEEPEFIRKLKAYIDGPLLEKKSLPRQLYISYSTDIILLANMSISLEWLSEQIENIIQFRYESQKGMREFMIGIKPKEIPSEDIEGMLDQLKTRRKKAAFFSTKNQESNSKNGTNGKKISVLEKYVEKYEILAHRTLFALKIDLRTRCVVQQIGPLIEGKYYLDEMNTEPDNYIQNLNKDLRRVEDCLMNFMPSTTIYFLLHRLSTLISQIFVDYLPKISQRKFNEHGVRKLQANIQALQQNITNMIHTHRGNEEFLEQNSFSRAIKYYELLLLSPKEVYESYVDSVESGEQLFSIEEYKEILLTDTNLNSKIGQKSIEQLMSYVQSRKSKN